MSKKTQYTNLIKTEAKRLGFLSCGVSKAEFLEEEAPKLESWLNQNKHGKMQYMENHFDKRLDPTLLVLSLIHISEPTRQAEISYAVFCLKKKTKYITYLVSFYSHFVFLFRSDLSSLV